MSKFRECNFFQNGLRLKIRTKFLKNKYNTLFPIKIASLEVKITLKKKKEKYILVIRKWLSEPSDQVSNHTCPRASKNLDLVLWLRKPHFPDRPRNSYSLKMSKIIFYFLELNFLFLKQNCYLHKLHVSTLS